MIASVGQADVQQWVTDFRAQGVKFGQDDNRAEIPPAPRFERNQQALGDSVSERIRNAISVYDFVSQHRQLDRGGKGLYPFHDDHRESFSVNIKENYWHCFACEIGGSVIHFYMRWYGVSYEEAVSELEKMLL